MSMDRAGTYRARPLGAELGWTKDHKPQVAVQFEILEEGCEGERMTWFGYFTEKSAKRTLESLCYCGWKGDDISDLASISAEDNTAEVDLVMGFEDYNGESRLKVQWVNQPGGGGAGLKEVMSPAEKKQFADRMKAQVLAMRGAKSAAPRKPIDRHPNAPGFDDDVGF